MQGQEEDIPSNSTSQPKSDPVALWVHFGPRQRYLFLYALIVSIGAGLLALAIHDQLADIAGMWLIAIGAGWVTARLSNHSLRSRLRRLREAADAIGRGELDHRIDLCGHDDFVKLAGSLDRMAARLEAHIGERESLQKDLARAEKLASLGELAATVAHEVNNPLDGLQNAVRIIRRTHGDTAQTGHLLDLMEAGLCRIERLVQRLMGLARCEPPRLEAVRISDAIDDALLFVQPRLNRSSVRVIRECPENTPPALADRMQIAQVLTNLLLNAGDAMPDGGDLTLAVHGGSDGRVVLEVRDTGTGICDLHLARIFEPFYSTKEPGQGTGLGLAVVARIVEAHHGCVTVQSTVGNGTTFRIELPAARDLPGTGRSGSDAELIAQR